MIAHHVITVPFLFLSREVIFEAKGCDCMKEGTCASDYAIFDNYSKLYLVTNLSIFALT